jgi:hypothetical protein
MGVAAPRAWAASGGIALYGYDSNGNEIAQLGATPLFNEQGWVPGMAQSRFVRVENTYSLPVDYTIDFSVGGTGLAGALDYRLTQVAAVGGAASGDFAPMASIVGEHLAGTLLVDQSVVYRLDYGWPNGGDADNAYMGSTFELSIVLNGSQTYGLISGGGPGGGGGSQGGGGGSSTNPSQGGSTVNVYPPNVTVTGGGGGTTTVTVPAPSQGSNVTVTTAPAAGTQTDTGTTTVPNTATPTGTIGDTTTPLAGGEGAHWSRINLILAAVAALLAIVMLLKYPNWRKRKDEQAQSQPAQSAEAGAAPAPATAPLQVAQPSYGTRAQLGYDAPPSTAQATPVAPGPGVGTAAGPVVYGATEAERQLAASQAASQRAAQPKPQVKRHLALRLANLAVALVGFGVFFLTEDLRQPMGWVDWYTLAQAALLIVSIVLVILSKKRRQQKS